MNFFGKLGAWFKRVMYGRYGTDQLSLFLAVLALGISIFPHIIANIITIVILAYIVFRTLSKNLYSRQKENMAYLRIWRPIKNFFKNLFTRNPDAKTHKYYTCPKCTQRVRVPKGKGKITITCPKCAAKFTKKT